MFKLATDSLSSSGKRLSNEAGTKVTFLLFQPACLLAFLPAGELKSNAMFFTPVATRLLILIAGSILMYLFCSVFFPLLQEREHFLEILIFSLHLLLKATSMQSEQSNSLNNLT